MLTFTMHQISEFLLNCLNQLEYNICWKTQIKQNTLMHRLNVRGVYQIFRLLAGVVYSWRVCVEGGGEFKRAGVY